MAVDVAFGSPGGMTEGSAFASARGSVRRALVWRPMARDDVPALVRLFRHTEQIDQTGTYTDEAEVAAHFAQPGLNLERDTLAAVLPDGELAGYAVVYPAPTARDVQRLFVTGGVHPTWRGRGLGRRILDWQLERAESMHREVRPHLPALVQAGGMDRNDPQGRVLRRAGFEPVRWWYEMCRDLSEPLPAAATTGDWDFVPFDASLDEVVRLAHNEAFADHWGSSGVDQESWRQRFCAAQGFRPELSLLALDGDEIAAYLLSFVHDAEIAATGVRAAHVGYLGTRPAWRRRGLGKALLCRALCGYRDAGYVTARLVVDTENGSGALDIYRRSGFEVDRRWVTYGRRLPPIPADRRR